MFTMTAHYAAETARADALVDDMIAATADVWAMLTDADGPDVNAAMRYYADAAAARQNIDALRYTNNGFVNPSNSTLYRAALADLRTADRAIADALGA